MTDVRCRQDSCPARCPATGRLKCTVVDEAKSPQNRRRPGLAASSTTGMISLAARLMRSMPVVIRCVSSGAARPGTIVRSDDRLPVRPVAVHCAPENWD